MLALPSLKEGWGLVVGEAALRGHANGRLRQAGGTRESIVDGVSGLLVDDRRASPPRWHSCWPTTTCRRAAGRRGRAHGGRYTWEQRAGVLRRRGGDGAAGDGVGTESGAAARVEGAG